MKLRDLSITFHTDKIAACVDFYTKYFQAKVSFDAGWYVSIHLQSDVNPHIFLSFQGSPDDTEVKNSFTGGTTLNLMVEDVDACWEQLQLYELSFAEEITDHEWGDRAFSLYDPIGNLVYVYSERPLHEKYKDAVKERMNLTIRQVTADYPYDLLLLADETIEGINKYLFDSEVYVATLPETEQSVGVFCLCRIDADTVEIMNIAVSENNQGNGIGSSLIESAVRIAEEKGYRQIILGTADCGIKQIRFYEKNGFVKYDIKKDYFTKKYDTPIYDNGIQLKDMVMLKREILKEI